MTNIQSTNTTSETVLPPESNRRRAERIATSFAVTLHCEFESQPFSANGITVAVTHAGANVVLNCDEIVRQAFQLGQRIIVATDLAELPAQINGLCTEPKEPLPEDSCRYFVGLKLLDGATWL